MLRRYFLACLLTFGSASRARVAGAEPTATQISAAKQAFESALSLEKAQRWAEAVPKLREAVAIKDTPGIRFHLAHCETEQGHLVAASLEYERATELLQNGASAPDVQKLLGPASEALERRIPRLTVELAADLRTPVVSVDGKPYPLSELSLGVPLDPGSHEVRVSAQGRRSFERRLLLKEGEEVAVSAELAVSTPATPESGAPIAAVAERPTTAHVPYDTKVPAAKLYVVIGESALVVAGLSVGIAYKVAQSSATDRINGAQERIDNAAPGDAAACGSANPSLRGPCSDLRSAIDDHDRAGRLANVAFIASGAGAVAVLATWLVWPDSSRESSGFSARAVIGLGQIGVQGRF